MGKVTGFMEIDRQVAPYQPASDRIRHFREFTLPLSTTEVQRQAARCMDCGVPFCHGDKGGDTGCPVNNQIPDWNDLVYSGQWQEAIANLHSTNNFPEFTGRVCPAPCEESCTLNLEDMPVAIKTIEQALADKAFELGLMQPQIAAIKTGKRVAIIGSGPAGLAAAQQLARAGHGVDVYERESRAGGLLRYGIPDFKMQKHLIDRRLAQMQGEGVNFHCGIEIGKDIAIQQLLDDYDAALYCGGAETPRDPALPGRELHGVYDAMPYLVQQNRRVGKEDEQSRHWQLNETISADGKRVVVVGGGDTASDCVGTAFRQGAVQVTQLDIRPEPPLREDKLGVWPYWATKLRISSSQAEGAMREFQVATLGFGGENGKLTHITCCSVDERRKPIAGTEFILQADLAFIALGFSGPDQQSVIEQLGERLKLKTDTRGNVSVLANTTDYRSTVAKLFVAGDVRRGQSLVVWAIREGRQAARAIDLQLMGASLLPS
ncbi:glutamate synthase subunit beta [Paenochrobactrum sp. BZR 588]|uniref:glutamate synthase subunit beta n=1 Tax=unclassified Paenochrobactrum TaxID=2639760 RepID=UPI0038555730